MLYKYDLIEGRLVADLFCGVGSLGLEALSRGAKFVTFIEKDHKIRLILEKNIARGAFVKKSKVLRANAFKIGAPVNFEGEKYSVVFVDPPYPLTKEVAEGSLLSGLLKILAEQLAPDGIVVVRTNKRIELCPRYSRLHILQRRVWGTMAITILGLANDE